MSRQEFTKTYKDYKNYYVEKKYDACINLLPGIKLRENYSQYKEHVEFVLRSACSALYSIKNAQAEQKIKVANSFAEIFSYFGTAETYHHLLTILTWFTDTKELESYLPLFTELKNSEFDIESWLKTASTNLFYTLRNANITNTSQTKQKELYVQLTQVLIFFVNAETQRMVFLKSTKCEFTESLRFLDKCQEYKLFLDGDSQYIECFKFLSEFLRIIRVSGSRELGQHFQNFIKRFKEIVKSNKFRATLIQDIFITVAKVTKICEQRFNQIIDSKNFEDFLDFIAYMTNGVHQTKTEKRFCAKCANTGIHLSHDLSMLVIDIYSRLVNKGLDEKTGEKIGLIIRTDFEVISKLECSKSLYLQKDAVYKFRSLMKNCESKETADSMISILKMVSRRCHRFKLEDAKLEAMSIISYLFTAFNTMEKWEQMIESGYLTLALMSVAESSSFDHIAWTLVKKQKEMPGTLAQKTPFDHFNQIKNESLFGITLPEMFSLSKLSLAYLRVGMKYAVMSTELSNKMVHQFLMLASHKDHSSLKFVLYVNSMNFDKITNERVETLAKSLKTKSKEDSALGLQIAAIKYYKFNYEVTELSEKYKDLSLSQALTEDQLALSTNVFKEITFKQEKLQIETLRTVKQEFLRFAEFYQKQNEIDRKRFDDEKDLLLRDLKVIANQFIVRGYLDESVPLYLALYRLATSVNDEWGVIDSCSFFAEYCVEFKPHYPDENLKSIIEKCFNCVINKVKELNKLSTRKQNQVCFCMLNLVLFYHEDDGAHTNEIHIILSYVFKTIGGVGDENMSNCMSAAVGFHVSADKKDAPKIHSEAVRIKFYSVLFTMVTKYNAPCTFNPAVFVSFVMEHLKKYIGVYYDSTAAVPILLYNMIPQMVIWLHSIYEVHREHQALIISLLKLATRSGYTLRMAILMVTLLQMNLLTEDLKTAKKYFTALDGVMSSQVVKSAELKSEKEKPYGLNEKGELCEPIRKQGIIISLIKKPPSSPTAQDMQKNAIKFLSECKDGCDCALCFSPQVKFMMYCAAVAYARYVYISEEFEPAMKRLIFNRVFEYWETNNKNKSKFPRSDMYYVISARMLLYRGHYTWKFEPKDRSKAVELLKRGLKGMGRVKYGACLLKEDLKYQIQEMEETIQQLAIPREERLAGMWILNRKKPYGNETKRAAAVKPIAPPKVTVTQTRLIRVNNLINIVTGASNSTSNFRIHADDEATTSTTPSAKKSARNRLKLDTADVHTPSTRTKPQGTASVPKTADRPKRNNRDADRVVPKIAVDLTESSPETNGASIKPVLHSDNKKEATVSKKGKPATTTRITRKAASKIDETLDTKNAN